MVLPPFEQQENIKTVVVVFCLLVHKVFQGIREKKIE